MTRAARLPVGSEDCRNFESRVVRWGNTRRLINCLRWSKFSLFEIFSLKQRERWSDVFRAPTFRSGKAGATSEARPNDPHCSLHIAQAWR